MENKKLAAYLENFVSERRRNLFDTILSKRTKHITVVLEDLFEKHNISAVARSCDIFGIQDLHIIENKYDSYVSNHVAKGAQKWIDFHNYNEQEHNTQICIDKLRANGYQIIATTPHTDSCVLEDFDITKKTAFVFGVEKAGVSDLIINQADGLLKIPMVGFTESLNISVAAALILNSTTTKLRNSNINWELTNNEKENIKLDWMKKSIKSIDLIIKRFKQNKI
ncbi:MAG TPA: TrmH family RNA methyltransferase [Flavobacteriaceae bacterium]|nr:TrmH family RNA methyltransferase [Flavobacteriaceae bacterium]